MREFLKGVWALTLSTVNATRQTLSKLVCSRCSGSFVHTSLCLRGGRGIIMMVEENGENNVIRITAAADEGVAVSCL